MSEIVNSPLAAEGVAYVASGKANDLVRQANLLLGSSVCHCKTTSITSLGFETCPAADTSDERPGTSHPRILVLHTELLLKQSEVTRKASLALRLDEVVHAGIVFTGLVLDSSLFLTIGLRLVVSALALSMPVVLVQVSQ